MNRKGPAYWRRQVRRGKIPPTDPRVTPAAVDQLDAKLSQLTRPAEPLRRR